MNHRFSSRAAPLAPALALLLVAAAQAQTAPAAPAASRANPADAQANVPLLPHRSAFEGYRGWASPPAVGWKAANDTAAKIGGWRAYAREAAAPEPAASAPIRGDAPPAPAVAPPAGHSGHGGHRMP